MRIPANLALVANKESNSIVLNSVLTPAQAEALGAIKALCVQQGYPPSLAEIAAALKVSRASARSFLLILVRKGYVARKPGQYRSITILERAA